MICTGVSWSTWCGGWLVSVPWWSSYCCWSCRSSSITYNCKHHWVVSVSLFSTHTNMKLGKSLDITPASLPHQHGVTGGWGAGAILMATSDHLPPLVILQRWKSHRQLAYWWMVGWLATLISTTSETLAVSTRADKRGKTVSHERDLARGCWEGEGDHWLPSIGLQPPVTPCWCRSLVDIISSDLSNFNLARPVHAVSVFPDVVTGVVVVGVTYNCKYHTDHSTAVRNSTMSYACHCVPPTFLPALPIWYANQCLTDVGSTDCPHFHSVELA